MFNLWAGLEVGLGIDLGTSNTVIYQKGKGIVLREPSVVAVNTKTGTIEACGEQAYAMIGRTPQNIEVVHPLHNGVVASHELTLAMLNRFIRNVLGKRKWFVRTRTVVSIPDGVTNVNKRAVEETILYKNPQKSITVEEPVAAAIGAGLPFYEPVGSMLIDIGGGLIQTAIVSLGGIVVSHTAQKGGNSIDRTISEYVKKCYNLVIGERTAEMIKQKIGTAVPPEREQRLEVRGNDLVLGLPRTVVLSSAEIYELLDDFILTLLDAIRFTLERCPPELAGDVMERGILLCGGGSLLNGLDQRLKKETGIPFHKADNPLECVAIGLGKLMSLQQGSARSARKRLWPEPSPDWNEQPEKGEFANGQMEALHEKPMAKA